MVTLEARRSELGIESSFNFRRVSDRVTTSGLVTAEDLSDLEAEGYEVVVNLLPDSSEQAFAGEAASVRGQGVGYVHIPVDFAAPSCDQFEEFAAVMDANAERRVHVHCAANYRVSAFYSLYAMRRGWWTAEEADEHVRSIWAPSDHPGWSEFIAAERERITDSRR